MNKTNNAIAIKAVPAIFQYQPEMRPQEQKNLNFV